VSKPNDIHPSAIVADGAVVGAGTTIGAYTVVGPEVKIGCDCRIGPHVVIEGCTSIGDDNQIFPFASLGGPPQDLKYAGEATRLEIGDRNIVRESTTLNRGTEAGGGATRIGSDNLFMAFSHVAHDCQIADHVVLANGCAPAGHVVIESHVIVGGLVGIHQHTRIGESAMLGGGAMIVLDVPPYCLAVGDRAKLQGPNVIGVKRRGFSSDAVQNIKEAYRVLFQSNLRLGEALDRLNEEYVDSVEVMKMIRFIEAAKRGICR